jgi:hypothetical protein
MYRGPGQPAIGVPVARRAYRPRVAVRRRNPESAVVTRQAVILRAVKLLAVTPVAVRSLDAKWKEGDRSVLQ